MESNVKVISNVKAEKVIETKTKKEEKSENILLTLKAKTEEKLNVVASDPRVVNTLTTLVRKADDKKLKTKRYLKNLKNKKKNEVMWETLYAID